MVEIARMAVSILIKRPNGKILLVSKEGLWTFPTGKLEISEDHPQALFREAKEELGIEEEEIELLAFLGPDLRSKDNDPQNPLTNFEHILCKVSTVVAKRIKFKEGDENISVWIKPLKASELENLDGLAREGLRRYLDKYICRKIRRRGNDEKGVVFERDMVDCQL